MGTKATLKGGKGSQRTGTMVFVATNGNDSWSGKLAEPDAKKTDGPFATLLRARDAVRELKQKGELKEPVTVMVRGGKYYLDETLVLNSQDSGTRDCPVIYTAYQGEKPILSGSRKLTGWKPYKGKILQCELPEAKGGKWKFRQLFFNGKRQIRARYPKFDPNDPLYGGWAQMEGPAEEGSNTAFKYKPGTFKHHWAKPTEAEVNVFPYRGWCNNIVSIKAIDEDKCIITLTHSIMSSDRAPWFRHLHFEPGNRFIVENLLEELDQPGEWCLDSEEGILYFWPPTDSIEGAEIVAPVLDCLIDISGTSYITISGFTFTETTGGDNLHHADCEDLGNMFPMEDWKYCGDALRLNRAEYCHIENNHFYAVGGNAVYLRGYNARHVIRNNEISYAGANGVCIAGARRQHPMFNQIIDNHIHHCGVINKHVAGVFAGLSDGNIIGHNSIHHMPHHGINLGSNGFGRNIVEYNEMRHTCLETHDTGAINAWMDEEGEERAGHIIWYNLIIDTGGPMSGTTKGIYLDDYSSNCLIFGNIIVRSSLGIDVHGGKNNIIENNIIAGTMFPMYYSDYVSLRTPHMVGFMSGNRFCRNIVYNTNPKARAFFLHHLSHMAAQQKVVHISGYNQHWLTDRVVQQSDYNLFFSAAGGKYLIEDISTAKDEDQSDVRSKVFPLAEWQKMGYDMHSVTADPLFVDTQHDDYRLKPKSPALKFGFQPIDVANIGIREEEPE